MHALLTLFSAYAAYEFKTPISASETQRLVTSNFLLDG